MTGSFWRGVGVMLFLSVAYSDYTVGNTGRIWPDILVVAFLCILEYRARQEWEWCDEDEESQP